MFPLSRDVRASVTFKRRGSATTGLQKTAAVVGNLNIDRRQSFMIKGLINQGGPSLSLSVQRIYRGEPLSSISNQEHEMPREISRISYQRIWILFFNFSYREKEVRDESSCITERILFPLSYSLNFYFLSFSFLSLSTVIFLLGKIFPVVFKYERSHPIPSIRKMGSRNEKGERERDSLSSFKIQR